MIVVRYVSFIIMICRGDHFRKTFAEIGTVRSLINKDINILALTATASSETAEIIFERLSMVNVKTIGLSPERPNIKYYVLPMPEMEDICSTLAKELIADRASMPKTVVFCQTLKQCGDFYAEMKSELGQYLTEPPGAPRVIPFSMVSMFTSASRAELRAEVLQEFCCEKTNLRLVIATTAFGLGVDCRDITRVINWGAPNSLEELVQETGRAGRNGSHSKAILYFGKGSNRRINKQVKQYGENKTVCRRTLLFKNFLFSEADKQSIVACKCCDLCTPLCVCNDCTTQVN